LQASKHRVGCLTHSPTIPQFIHLQASHILARMGDNEKEIYISIRKCAK